jgi:hypothetical protein
VNTLTKACTVQQQPAAQLLLWSLLQISDLSGCHLFQFAAAATMAVKSQLRIFG